MVKMITQPSWSNSLHKIQLDWVKLLLVLRVMPPVVVPLQASDLQFQAHIKVYHAVKYFVFSSYNIHMPHLWFK